MFQSFFRPDGFYGRQIVLARDFFAAVPGSLKNHLNREELNRITVTTLSAGGGVFGLLQALLSSVGVLFPAPADAALAAAVLTLILEALRRLNQGVDIQNRSRFGPSTR